MSAAYGTIRSVSRGAAVKNALSAEPRAQRGRLVLCAFGPIVRTLKGAAMNRSFLVAGLGMAAVATMAGCKSTSVNSTPVATADTQSAGASTTTPPSVAHVGSTVRVAGVNNLSANVTVTKVVDPATGADQFTTPDQGKRFVAVVLQIVSTTSSTLQGDADNDLTVIGSDNQTYQPDFSAVQGCTNFNSGSYTLSSGESTTGCVTFQVPTGVTVVKIRFEPSSGLPGTKVGEWVNP